MSAATPTACAQCGSPLPDAAVFCRHCGAKREPTAEATAVAGTAAGSGRCGSCGTELRPGNAFCHSCGAGVAAEAKPGSQSPPKPEPVAVAPLGGGGRRWTISAAIVVLLLVGAGGAVALSKSGGGSDAGARSAAAPAAPASAFEAETEPEAEAAAPETEQEASPEPAGFPEVPRGEMEAEIRNLLLEYHEDVIAGDTRAAWSLLSSRKRQQDLREYGFRDWAKAQASLAPYLEASGLEVDVEALEDEGVARVMVTGMGWSDPGASCSEWAGLTWVKYESGGWTYDPGYSTTATRRREWQPRADALLGTGC